MNRKDILALARTKMDQHGLLNWTVKFMSSKSVAGLCRIGRWNDNPRISWGVIELSTDYFDVFSDYDILDTILHEIAHALTKPEFKRTRNGSLRQVHHGPEWKRTARRIGCSGDRCVRAEANRPQGAYKGICPNGHEISRHRLTENAKMSSCPRCSSRFDSRYMFNWFKGSALIHSRPVQAQVQTKPKAFAEFSKTGDLQEQERLIREILQKA